MELALARHIVRSAFRSAAELQSLLPLLEAHTTPSEYETYLHGIATVLATIGDEVTNRVLAANPGLADEVDASISTYGRLV
jgi:hypothetical protein